MFLNFLRSMIYAAVKVTGKICPNCKRSDNIDVENNIYYCHNCGHEW